MASSTGTATGFNDLYDKLIAFVTTNATLVSANQQWTKLREWKDNVDTITNTLNVTKQLNIGRTFTYDSRITNVDSVETATGSGFYKTSITMGSEVVVKLITAKKLGSIQLQARHYTPYLGYMIKDFSVYYSNNGTSWTLLGSSTNNTGWASGETRTITFTPPGTAQLYYKIIIDAVNSGTNTVAWETMRFYDEAGNFCNSYNNEVILKATGLASSDEIFTGIRTSKDTTEGWYNFILNGYTGYNSAEYSFFEQPGALPSYGETQISGTPMVPCWDTSMDYWFSATGRSLKFSIKVSTIFEGGYLGFFLPAATSGQYPYPLAVGGSLAVGSNYTSQMKYSDVSTRHATFTAPGSDSQLTTSTVGASLPNCTLYLLSPDNVWLPVTNRNDGTVNPESINQPIVGATSPYTPSGGARVTWPHSLSEPAIATSRSNFAAYSKCLGGDYLPIPIHLFQSAPVPNFLGFLEDCYYISGFENAAENTTTIDTKSAVIFQNTYRTAITEYWALTL